MMTSADKDHSVARRRILDTAYKLFSTEGINSVGIDTIVARSGSAKMTLYRHFKSKEALIVAFLARREELWTRQWLEENIFQENQTAEERLLGIFDVLDAWFRQPDFEGCAFTNTLLEGRHNECIRIAAAQCLSNIRAIVERLGREAGLLDVERFARTWHVMMKGSIVARHEGQLDAALETKRSAELLLSGWPRFRHGS